MALRSVTWFLIVSCLAALAVSAPTSSEESSEDSTTVGAVILPGEIPHDKRTKRESEKQEADKPENPIEVAKKPGEPAYTKPTEATSRVARDAEEKKPESQPAKPSESSSDAKKDESKPKSKRETPPEKDGVKKPALTVSKPEATRPERDVDELGKQKKEGDVDSNPTSIPDYKKEERRQK